MLFPALRPAPATSLALYRTRDADGARRTLAEAKKLIDETFLVQLGGELQGYWHDWPAAQFSTARPKRCARASRLSQRISRNARFYSPKANRGGRI